ncbi:hypothetical protein N7447_005703 [Penicillium robsamsonii]|uniref:uncharacterized protein n=1 Tax=Penicillium robsamsonii TaxID=1792511 RepID=UPI0025498B8A|nr:uncharacterized protein N7447_005703 [Penicillium robsamsonii]KAJ5823363.1 hypothetical protein N7447_005703 [Penicillium robsamsonii]
MSTSQSSSAGSTPGINININTGPVSQGSHWRAYGPYHPQVWAEPGKFLCDCLTHDEWQWPTEHAELTIAPCAYRCPFCDEFNKAGRSRLMASNLRRHITKTHIEGYSERFGTLVVAAGVIGNRRDVPRPADGKDHLGAP